MIARELMSPADIERLTARSDLRALWLVLCQWVLTLAILAVVAIWPNPVTVVLAVLLLGGRQLGFGVLVHECGHRSLFRSPLLNDLVADWLLAPPTFNDRVAYMRGHVGHHRLAGTAEDPDLPNYQDYPISRARLRRKLARDLTGKTGFRTLAGILSAWRRYPTLAPERQAALRRGLGMQIVLFAGMTLAGAPWLYLVWIGAFVFTNPLVSRLRQIAEHAAVPDRLDPDPRRNTRTVLGGAIARLLVCPHRINYHLEHHLLPSVPIYRLRAMHALLQANGSYRDVPPFTDYRALFRAVANAG